MAKKNRECATCGVKYSYCPNCNRKAPAWMSAFHDENCKNIFKICTSFNVDVLSKAEARAALEMCDLSNKENFKSAIKQDFENIFAVEGAPAQAEEPKKRNKRAEMPIAVEPEAHEVVE